jgi:general secretion pathway protein G
MSEVRKQSLGRLIQVLLAVPAALICALTVSEMAHVWNTERNDSVFRSQARRRFTLLRGQLDAYRTFHGAFPKSLADLTVPSSFYVVHARDPAALVSEYDGHFDKEGRPLDPWGFPYHYAAKGNTFELFSTGADGAPGGVGIDADLNANDPPGADKGPTLLQLIWDRDSAKLDSLFRGSLCFGVSFFVYAAVVLSEPPPTSRRQYMIQFMIACTAMLVIFTVLVCVALGIASMKLSRPPTAEPSIVCSPRNGGPPTA